MKLTKLNLLATVVLTTGVMVSCSDDDLNTPVDNVEVPTTYSFDRNNSSTVSFSGQSTRIAMAEELQSAFKNPSLQESDLDGMYAHIEGEADFSDPSLNASNKNVRSKTAASADYFSANSTDAAAIKADFDGFISAQVAEVFPVWNNTASAGVPGQLQEAGGGSVRYINAKGLEYDQAFGKSLIGALFMDQMLNNYLSTAVLDAGDNRLNNDNKVLAAGKNYTTMEHKWDEAYGYLYGAEPNAASPVLGQDSFLNKYLNRLESDPDYAGVADEIYDAFKLGRAAIVANEYELRDAQAEIIREKISLVAGVRAVYYLESAKGILTSDPAAAFHDLSEAYGFIYSLQFTRQPGTNTPYFSKSEVDAYLSQLMQNDGFWDVTPTTLESMSAEIAARFGLNISEAAN